MCCVHCTSPCERSVPMETYQKMNGYALTNQSCGMQRDHLAAWNGPRSVSDNEAFSRGSALLVSSYHEAGRRFHVGGQRLRLGHTQHLSEHTHMHTNTQVRWKGCEH